MELIKITGIGTDWRDQYSAAARVLGTLAGLDMRVTHVYLMTRYSGWHVTWEGVESFDPRFKDHVEVLEKWHPKVGSVTLMLEDEELDAVYDRATEALEWRTDFIGCLAVPLRSRRLLETHHNCVSYLQFLLGLDIKPQAPLEFMKELATQKNTYSVGGLLAKEVDILWVNT